MRRTIHSAIIGLLILPLVFSSAKAGFNFGISGDDDGLNGFYLAVGDYYNVPDRYIVAARERHIPDDEMPVVFFIARKADVNSSVIIDMRNKGQSWMDISMHFKLHPEVYYVKVDEDPGPPYGRALGHFRNRDKDRWGTIVLDDRDIINLVNLRFISEYNKVSPEHVMRWRGEGKNFVTIHSDIKKSKNEGKKKEKNKEKSSEKKEKSKKDRG